MRNIIILHGTGGDENENWIPYIKKELTLTRNYSITTPSLPTPENQSLKNWNNSFSKYVSLLDSESIIVGHSIACAFILNVIQNLKNSIYGCVLVSPFIENINITKFDNLNYTFYEKKFDFNKIKNNCNKFIIFHGNNDPYVPLKLGQNVSNLVNGEMIVIQSGGHLNKTAGFVEFKELLQKIKELN